MLFSGIVKDRMMVVCELKDGKLKTIYDLLKDGTIVRSYPNLFLTSSTLDMPYLVCEDAYDFSSVFGLLDSDEIPSDDVLVQIKQAIDDILPLSVDDYKMLFEGLKELKSYFNETKVVINFPIGNYENFKQTKSLVDRVKEVEGDMNIKDNKTLFRETPNSELFVVVPSPDMLSMSMDPTSSIVKMDNVFIPFKEKDRDLYGVNYSHALKRSGVAEELVLGDPKNNTYEIFPEEERYFNALKKLHEVLVEREKKYKNNPDEEGEDYSELFKDYITYMIIEALRYHRNQMGFISLKSFVEDDEDDDEEVKNGDEMSVDLLYAYKKNIEKFDGDSVIESLVSDQIKKNPDAPIHILIQALRFGDKLPSKIQLYDGRFFDLKEFSYTNMSGSFDSYEVQKTALGNNYSVLGVVNLDNKIIDGVYASSVGFNRPKLESPVGLILKKSFVNSDKFQLFAISFVDLVNFVGVDESLTIDGISRVDGKLVIDESVLKDGLLDDSMSLVSLVTQMKYPAFISYINPYMKGDFIECGAFTNSLSTLKMLNDVLNSNELKKLNYCVVVSKEDAFDKVRSSFMPIGHYLQFTVCYYLLDTVIKADKAIYDLSLEKFDYSISDVISIYDNIVGSLDYPVGIYTDEMNKKPSSSPSQATGTMSNSNVFGGQQTTKPSSQPVAQPSVTSEKVEGGNMYNLDNLFYKGEFPNVVMVVLPTEVVNKVNLTYKELNQPFQINSIQTSGDNTVVGYLTQVNGCYVFLEPKTYSMPVKGKFLLTKLKSNILSILRTVASGQTPKIKFDSLQTLEYYCRILEKC